MLLDPVCKQAVLLIRRGPSDISRSRQGENLSVKLDTSHVTAIKLFLNDDDVMTITRLHRRDARMTGVALVVTRTHTTTGEMRDMTVGFLAKRFHCLLSSHGLRLVLKLYGIILCDLNLPPLPCAGSSLEVITTCRNLPC